MNEHHLDPAQAAGAGWQSLRLSIWFFAAPLTLCCVSSINMASAALIRFPVFLAVLPAVVSDPLLETPA